MCALRGAGAPLAAEWRHYSVVWHYSDVALGMHATVCPPSTAHLQTKRRAEVLDEILKSWPALFHRWWLARFAEPAAWLNARLAYTRTSGGCGVLMCCGMRRRCRDRLFMREGLLVFL